MPVPVLDVKTSLALLGLGAYLAFLVALGQPWTGILAIASVIVGTIAGLVYWWFKK